MSVTSTHWGTLPACRLQHSSGASALITLYGAHLVEWISADGISRVFCSKQSSRDGSKAIRGGVPVIFPQFAAQGSGMRHGFARISHWRQVATATAATNAVPCQAVFELAPADLDAEVARAWPDAFALRLCITLGANSLELHFSVDNRDAAPFDFAAALHSYWAVAELAASRIHGLQHLTYTDQTTAPATAHEEQADTLLLSGNIDRIYRQCTAPLQLTDDHHGLRLEQHGFCDAVVWNPGEADAKALSDLADEEFHRFVCVEAARISPVRLASGEKWEGWQRVEAVR